MTKLLALLGVLVMLGATLAEPSLGARSSPSGNPVCPSAAQLTEPFVSSQAGGTPISPSAAVVLADWEKTIACAPPGLRGPSRMVVVARLKKLSTQYGFETATVKMVGARQNALIVILRVNDKAIFSDEKSVNGADRDSAAMLAVTQALSGSYDGTFLELRDIQNAPFRVVATTNLGTISGRKGMGKQVFPVARSVWWMTYPYSHYATAQGPADEPLCQGQISTPKNPCFKT